MSTLRGFISRHGISMTAELINRRPDGHMSDMPAGTAHYRCTLRSKGKRLTVYFSQGPAICKEPTAEDVLDCLASDAAGFANARGFEDWCAEYGYDEDSRKAAKIYRTIEKQAAKLEAFIPAGFIDNLLFQTERA